MSYGQTPIVDILNRLGKLEKKVDVLLAERHAKLVEEKTGKSTETKSRGRGRPKKTEVADEPVETPVETVDE